MTAHDQLARLLAMENGARGVMRELGVDRRMVQRWAKGREIPPQHAAKIGEAYRRVLRERLGRALS